jgi:hypothetical protein
LLIGGDEAKHQNKIMLNIFQELQLNELRAKQSDSDLSLKKTGLDLDDIARQLRKMALVNQALYELLKERLDISDEDLRRKIREIDLRDGTADGKLDASSLRCPKCRGAVTAGAFFCLTCGATVAPKYPYEV